MGKSPIEIVLVEDNENDAEMTIRALRKNNVVNNLVHLHNGVEALDFLFGIGEFAGRDVTEQPRLILLDLKMPMIDGFEVLEKVKGSPITRKIPVVALTSSSESPDIEKCYMLGANSYIVKPVEFDDFMKAYKGWGYTGCGLTRNQRIDLFWKIFYQISFIMENICQ